MSHELIAPSRCIKTGTPLPDYLPVSSWIPTLPKLGRLIGFSQRILWPFPPIAIKAKNNLLSSAHGLVESLEQSTGGCNRPAMQFTSDGDNQFVLTTKHQTKELTMIIPPSPPPPLLKEMMYCRNLHQACKKPMFKMRTSSSNRGGTGKTNY